MPPNPMELKLRACVEISMANQIMNSNLEATESLIQTQITLEKAGGKGMLPKGACIINIKLTPREDILS